MTRARWRIGSKAGGGLHVPGGVLFVALMLFAISLPAAAARAGELGTNDTIVLAALGGVEPLPVGEMAKESARGIGNGAEPSVEIPIAQPTVRLWDDFGAFSPSSIGNTIVTISSGAGQ